MWTHYVQVIKNIRNVTRHRNGQSVKSRQTKWEWQMLTSIMHIHDVVTRYNNCAFLCAWHVNITVFFALPPCSKDVLVDDQILINKVILLLILHFCFRQCVSQCHKFSCLMLNSYIQCRKDIEYCFHIDFCTWLLHVQTSTCTCTQEWAIVVACHHIMNMHDGN